MNIIYDYVSWYILLSELEYKAKLGDKISVEMLKKIQKELLFQKKLINNPLLKNIIYKKIYL